MSRNARVNIDWFSGIKTSYNIEEAIIKRKELLAQVELSAGDSKLLWILNDFLGHMPKVFD